ncbi:endonuclease Q family protein [Cohnella zeiphila]|uniref:TIGR00375 family protein n=1 Tax=Cohnella zeiphila TaxID=2761120 RepID=A0A7X0SI82_9BACL|nr:endonuclease Q family protein [Cohnella zeiphila]MBB6730468.1 TIGR00375 family protein [Cohnella zeiphila]
MTSLRTVFADLHVHIGSSDRGEAVKISASRNLTFRSIAREASERKGVELVGVIDCHSPAVQEDIAACLESGEMEEAAGGGIRYRNTVILLGCELEVMEPGGGPFHLLAYLPTIDAMRGWTAWMMPRMKNVRLSSQRIRATAGEVQRELLARGGVLVPAHIFTPHRGLLGCSADRVADRLDPAGVAAVELGLSADTEMASGLSQLDSFPFLTNSDAHSTGMIGRECNELRLAEPTFEEWVRALRGEGGRGIAANIGLHPQLGKYHTTYCAACKTPVGSETADVCPHCGSARIVRGVSGRVGELTDRNDPEAAVAGRPPYRGQVPLSFFPGVGPKMREKLLAELGTEMNVLHRASPGELERAAGTRLAELIMAAREGTLSFEPGSGGKYGAIAVSAGGRRA